MYLFFIQMQVMSKLRDPLRFAAFVQGASHIRDEEILRFESSKYDEDDSNDSDISLNDSEAENEQQQQQQRYSSRKSFNGRRSRSRPLNHDDISEDEDFNEGGGGSYRGGTPLNSVSHYNYSRASTSSASRQRGRNITPTTKEYGSSRTSVTRTINRTSRREEHEEFEDDS